MNSDFQTWVLYTFRTRRLPLFRGECTFRVHTTQIRCDAPAAKIIHRLAHATLLRAFSLSSASIAEARAMAGTWRTGPVGAPYLPLKGAIWGLFLGGFFGLGRGGPLDMVECAFPLDEVPCSKRRGLKEKLSRPLVG